jgi:lambda repressor-like predicted transcriptional regulator
MSKRPLVIHDYREEFERQARLWPEDGFMYAIMEYTRAILEAMEEQGVTRAELARRAQLKPSYVSRVLNNPENITLRTAFRLSTSPAMMSASTWSSPTSAMARSSPSAMPSPSASTTAAWPNRT